MNKLPNDSRREFLHKVTLGGAALVISESLLLADGSSGPVASTRPLSVATLPQPSTEATTRVSFSPVNKRLAVAAGTLEHVALYVASATNPGEFACLWAPSGDVAQINAVEWSPDDTAIAFIATTLDSRSTPKSGWTSLYVVDVTSGAVQELVRIEEETAGRTTVTTEVDANSDVTWYDNSAVCVCSQDNAVLTVDRNTGRIDTLISAQSSGRLCSIAVTESGHVRLLTKSIRAGSQHDIDVSVSEFRSGEVVSCVKVAPDVGKIILADLSPDGNYVFLHVVKDSGSKLGVYDARDGKPIKEIPAYADDGADLHVYIPVAIHDRCELILLHGTTPRGDKPEAIQGEVDDDGIALPMPDITLPKKRSCKLAKVPL